MISLRKQKQGKENITMVVILFLISCCSGESPHQRSMLGWDTVIAFSCQPPWRVHICHFSCPFSSTFLFLFPFPLSLSFCNSSPRVISIISVVIYNQLWTPLINPYLSVCLSLICTSVVLKNVCLSLTKSHLDIVSTMGSCSVERVDDPYRVLPSQHFCVFAFLLFSLLVNI